MPSSVYDIEIEFSDADVLKTWGVDEILYLRNLQNRKLYLTDDIESYVVNDIIHHIIQYNVDDKGIPVEDRKPILLYCTSNGGSVDAGFELIDIIQQSKTPVWTINLGYNYSMALLIGLAGHKRFATPNSKFLMHDGSSIVYNSGAKAQDQMEFNKRVEQRIKQFVLDRTSISPEEYDARLREEWYLFADEAKRYNMTDYIIGVDCELDDVI